MKKRFFGSAFFTQLGAASNGDFSLLEFLPIHRCNFPCTAIDHACEATRLGGLDRIAGENDAFS